MIQLHPDCLIFRTSSGESIPCSAETVTIELIGDSAGTLDPEVVREAAAAVVFYFKHDLGREQVSVEEFSRALQKVLDKLGYEVISGEEDKPAATEPATILNLPMLATASGKGFELFFFQRLRSELQAGLKKAPQQLRCEGLRTCVKQLTGARRWSPSCERMSDQIVDYLRECFGAEQTAGCRLVVE